MTRERLTPTIEDYLSVIFVLERDGEPVVGARVAELMGVTPPTVTNTLKRMVRDGLVEMDVPRGAHLTESGQEAARSVIRRHMLTEWMLSRMLSWSKLHQEAHQLEHAISDEMEAALQIELKQPELCPHGNPLPGYESVVEGWQPLTLAQAGERVIIRRIHELAEEMPEMLAFLEAKGVGMGQSAQVKEVLPFNQTVTLALPAGEVTLGFAAARYIFVERSLEQFSGDRSGIAEANP